MKLGWIGIDVGGTKTRFDLFDDGFRLAHSIKIKTAKETEDFKNELKRAVKSLVKKAAGRLLISGIGVGFAGPIDTRKGIVQSVPNIPGLAGFSFKKALAAFTGGEVTVSAGERSRPERGGCLRRDRLHYAIRRGIAGIDSVSIVFRPYQEIPPNMSRLVKALLAHGAKPNAQVAKDFPPYSRSPYALQTSLVGVTPFLLAAAAADLDLMHVLLDAGADPHIKSKEGATALMFTSRVERIDERENNHEDANALEAVKLALMLGDNIDAANTAGRTALHGAAGIGATPSSSSSSRMAPT